MEQMRINVPEGCTARIEQEGGLLIVSFEQKEMEKSEEWEPKDGDVIAFGERGLGVFKGYAFVGHTDYVVLLDGRLHFNEAGWIKDDMRPATDSEKQRLFDALAKKGKRWNAKEKRIEDLPRWRAEYDECYYFIDSELIVSYQPDVRCKTDNNRHEAGNYFKTKEAAERVASQIREIFKKSKAE